MNERFLRIEPDEPSTEEARIANLSAEDVERIAERLRRDPAYKGPVPSAKEIEAKILELAAQDPEGWAFLADK